MSPLRVTAKQVDPGCGDRRAVQVWLGNRLIGQTVLRPGETLGDFIKQSVRNAQAQEARP